MLNQLSKIVICSALIALTACATTQSFQRSMTAFTGKSESELVRQLGTPDQYLKNSGQTILVFRPITANIPMPSPTQISGLGGAYISPRASASYALRANCQVFFILKSGIVSDWYSQGKDCPKR